MSPSTARTVRKDLTILTSLALAGLVLLSALTGLGTDETDEVLPVDDIHPLIGFAMTFLTGVHVLLHLGVIRTHVRRRLDDLSRAVRPVDAGGRRAPDTVD